MAVITMGTGFNAKAWESGDRDQPMDVRYVGRVLQTYERNGYDDSDFVAIVFTEDNEFKHTVYASTRGWSYPNSAKVDATDEIKDMAEAYLINRFYDQLVAQFKAEDRRPTWGKTVRVKKAVTRGKNKVAEGVEGVVTWYGDDYYSNGKRVGIDTDAGRVFLSASNVEVTERNPIPYEELLNKAKAYARQRRKQNQWRM